MPTLEITITVPAGTAVVVNGLSGSLPQSSLPLEAAVELYWRQYLSDNTRRLFRAAANHETLWGAGYSLADLAQTLSVDYETVRSYQQTSGRIARKWREDQGAEAPIRLRSHEYHAEPGGQMRTIYGLPEGVASIIETLPITP